MRLLVVAGHGDGDPGATGNGYFEYERARTLASRMKDLGGDEVLLGDMSRNWYADDLWSSVDTGEFDTAIEIHLDSWDSDGPHGGHVVIKAGTTPDEYDNALAAFIGDMFPGRSALISGQDWIQNVNVCAARGINYRLLETCFISNSDDMDVFNANIDKVATGILAAFGIEAGEGGSMLDVGEPYNSHNLTYWAHVAYLGSLDQVRDGQMAGTQGRSLRLEGFSVDTTQLDVEGVLRLGFQTHQSGVGWVDDGEATPDKLLGTQGQSRAIEAVMPYIIENTTGKNVYFTVHAADYGWLPVQQVTPRGTPAGSTGQSRQLEAIKIWLN